MLQHVGTTEWSHSIDVPAGTRKGDLLIADLGWWGPDLGLWGCDLGWFGPSWGWFGPGWGEDYPGWGPGYDWWPNYEWPNWFGPDWGWFGLGRWGFAPVHWTPAVVGFRMVSCWRIADGTERPFGVGCAGDAFEWGWWGGGVVSAYRHVSPPLAASGRWNVIRGDDEATTPTMELSSGLHIITRFQFPSRCAGIEVVGWPDNYVQDAAISVYDRWCWDYDFWDRGWEYRIAHTERPVSGSVTPTMNVTTRWPFWNAYWGVSFAVASRDGLLMLV